jgi:hypothetical protein
MGTGEDCSSEAMNDFTPNALLKRSKSLGSTSTETREVPFNRDSLVRMMQETVLWLGS